MEKKGESKEKARAKDNQAAEGLRIARVTYGTRNLADCMEAVIRLHMEK